MEVDHVWWVCLEQQKASFQSVQNMFVYTREGVSLCFHSGVVLGDTWISSIDFLYAWPPLLQSFSMIDEAGASSLLRYADLAQSEMKNGNYLNATMIWGDMEEAVLRLADDVLVRIFKFGLWCFF